MNTLQIPKEAELKELESGDPEMKKFLEKEKVLMLTKSPKIPLIDPLVAIEICVRKCERLGVFEK